MPLLGLWCGLQGPGFASGVLKLASSPQSLGFVFQKMGLCDHVVGDHVRGLWGQHIMAV